MTWFLLAPDGSLIASGSWQAVIEEGAEEGIFQRRFSSRDGSEAAPKIRRGYVMAPAAMFPSLEERLAV